MLVTRQSSSTVSSAVVQNHGGIYPVHQGYHRSVSQQYISGYGYGAHPAAIQNPLYTPEAIEYQPQPIGFGPFDPRTAAPRNMALPAIENSQFGETAAMHHHQRPNSALGDRGHSNCGYLENEPNNPTGIRGRGPSRTESNNFQAGPPTATETRENIPVCTILKRIFSALLIIGDVFIDWTSLADVITGTNSDESSLTENEKMFTFSFPKINDAIAAINNSRLESSGCDSSAYRLTFSYGSFVVFGALFSIVKLLNIVGETIREIGERNQKRQRKDKKSGVKKLKSVGFQILHGWVETFLALLFEDLPQNVTVWLYSFTCKSKALNPYKVLVSMVGSFVKNIVRKSTCKQKSACACCLYRQDCGCMSFTCCSLIYCSCCRAAQQFYPDGSLISYGELMPIEDVDDDCICCKCVNLEWGYEMHFPPLCSCGRYICIKQMGCCINKFDDKACCKLDCYGCCGKRIDKDPIWIEKYITQLQLGNIVIIVLYLIRMFIGTLFSGIF